MTESTNNTASRARKLVAVLVIASMLTAVMIVIATRVDGVAQAAAAFGAYALAMAILGIAYTSETLLRDPLRILAERIGLPKLAGGGS